MSEKIQKLLKQASKKELEDLLFLLENPEYEERPVDIKTFIESEEYLGAKDECWETVKQELIEFYSGDYDEAIFCKAIGAGKTYETSIIAAYETYKLGCLKNPQKTLGLATGSRIAVMNCSIRAEQAKDVVFGEIKARIDNSKWFQEKFKPNPDVKSELQFPKNVYIIPGNSRETFPLGYNIFVAMLDEAAWFTMEGSKRDVVEEIYYMLKRRAMSRFLTKDKRIRGKIIVMTSPRYVDDFVEKLIRENDKRRFVSRKALWDMKPFIFSGKMVETEVGVIPVELVDEMRKNPEKFKRDFMAIPSYVIEAYIKDRKAIEECQDESLVYIDSGALPSTLQGSPHYEYFGHLDLGIKKDACGIAIGHREGDIVIIDVLIRLKPHHKNGEVSLGEVRGYIYALRGRGFRIKYLSADMFQSIDTIQQLKQRGIEAGVLSVDRTIEPYETLKELIYTRRIRYPKSEDLVNELTGLELVEGKKVDHRRGGSKDLSDSIAGAVYNILQKGKGFSFGFVNKEETVKEKKKKEIEVSKKYKIISSEEEGFWEKVEKLRAENEEEVNIFENL